MVQIGKDFFTAENFHKVVFANEPVTLSAEVISIVEKSNQFLKQFSEGKIIYGINTGLGPMAQFRVEASQQVALQKNLIRSHAAGIGEHQSNAFVKGAMLNRLVVFSKGLSGVSLETLETLVTFINNDIIPVVSKHGGVGASGDLVQLAQIALCLIGEGEVYYEGRLEKTAEVLNRLKLKPLNIDQREGLALINGTSFMSSVGLINVLQAKRALKQATLNGCLLNELTEAFDDYFSVELNRAKAHKNQLAIAENIREVLKGSKLIKHRQDEYYNGVPEEKEFSKKVQEYYSLRCLPQILGAIHKTIFDAEEVLIDEINSVSDNPIVDVDAQHIFHGGNFHGDFIGAEMSKLKNAMIKLTVLTERQHNFLLNHKLNDIFPPFLNAGTLGLTLGLQGAQYAATSTTAESQTLSASAYVHSIPSNNDNQDVVSMGTNEALLTHKVIDNFFDVNSVMSLAIHQASILKNKNELLAEKTANHLALLSKAAPFIKEDAEIRPILERIKNLLSEL
ncbi:MAG TPA: aromatic amino acid ammonia-lyase [Chitinophagales bacterium]